jgi:hypothetical protein
MVTTSEIMNPQSTRLSYGFHLSSKKKNRSGHIGVTFKGKSELKNIFSMFQRLYVDVLNNPSDPEPLSLKRQNMCRHPVQELRDRQGKGRIKSHVCNICEPQGILLLMITKTKRIGGNVNKTVASTNLFPQQNC